MKLIQVQNQSGFKAYDNQVQQGSLSIYNSNKEKPIVRQDTNGQSYKVYESEINLDERISRFIAVTFLSLIAAPLWSKDCRRLWNEAYSGKEKVKVISADELDEVVSSEKTDKAISLRKPNQAPGTERTKTDRPGPVKILNGYVDRLFDANGAQVPSTFVIFMHLKVDSQTIDKQFIFKAENGEVLNRADIKQRISKYYKNEFIKEFNVKNAMSVKYHVITISQNQNGFLVGRHKVALSSERQSNQETFGNALEIAGYWLQESMPNVKKAYSKGEFLKLEGIYQPV